MSLRRPKEFFSSEKQILIELDSRELVKWSGLFGALWKQGKMGAEHRRIKRRVGKQVSTSVTHSLVNTRFKQGNLIAFERSLSLEGCNLQGSRHEVLRVGVNTLTERVREVMRLWNLWGRSSWGKVKWSPTWTSLHHGLQSVKTSRTKETLLDQGVNVVPFGCKLFRRLSEP